MEGYIKLHRKIMHNPIFNDLQLYRLWSIILLNASYTNRKIMIDGQLVDVEPGQWVVGRFSLFDNYNSGLPPKDRVKGEKTPYRWLEKLEKMGYLNLEKTNKFTVINIVNWGIYQSNDQENDQQIDHQMTNKRPSNDHQMTTNKKVKKEKKEKKVNKIQYADFVSLELSEYETLIKEHGETAVKEMIKVLDNYKGASGKKYVSDYRAILNWVVDRVKQPKKGGHTDEKSANARKFVKENNIPF